MMATKKPLTLKAREHQQALDYLRMAESASNPAIAEVAASMAQERMRHLHAQDGKISSGAAVALATIIAVAAAMGCGFVILHYPQRVGLEIAGIIITLAVLLIGVYALLSGHLSQANFMIIFQWAGDHLKSIFCNPNPSEVKSLQADAGGSSETKRGK